MGGERRLFDPETLRVERPWQGRLRSLAGRAQPAPSSARAARADEAYEALSRLRKIGFELARAFELRFASIEAEQEGVNEHYGVCYRDGVIRIRLRHAKTGRMLKESSLVDTLCHELAHLRHFDHSPRFHRYYRRILREARERGHYRPRIRTQDRDAQRALFGDGRAAPAGGA